MPQLNGLPLVGTRETDDLDFKQSASHTDTIELAKDVAALANTLGGTVLVGADSSASILTGCPGISAFHASALETAYEEAVKNRCVPPPRIAFQRFPIQGSANVALAVYVWPSPVAPVGVSVKQTGGGKLVDEAWCFPWRANSHTKYLRPDQFGSLQDMDTRQTAALLVGITEDDAVLIRSSAPLTGSQAGNREDLGRVCERTWANC